MRLEWINNDKVIVNYRVEFKNNSHNANKIRIVKYTQIIEIINTEYSEVYNDR